jgi:hypothetical protein
MAEWKKVVVSGSNISQLNNDAGYITSVTATNTFATMSINGISVLADSSTDTLTFASSSGAGLNIVGDAGADSITFTLGAIPNASLANSAVTVTAGNGLTDGGSVSLGGSTTLNVGAGTHITVNANDIAVNTATLIPAISGSILTTVSGDISITAQGVATIGANSVALGTDTTGDYVANITSGAGLTGGTTGEGSTPTLAVGAGTHITVNVDDVAVNTTTLTPAISGSILSNISGDITITAAGVSSIGSGVIVNADVNASAAIAASKINFAGTSFVSASSIASGAQGEVTLTTNGVAASAVDLGLQTSDSPTFAGLTLTNGNIAVNNGTSTAITTTGTTAAVFNTNATTVNAFGAATTLNLGAATGTTTVGNSLVVTGDLYVNGTTTQVNTTELYVEDKFIVLASGSATAADAGIMIDRGSDAQGNIAFGFDVATDRWGYQNGLSDVSGSMVIGTNGNSAFAGYVFTEAAHTATKPTTGEFVQAGAIYANTDGTLWMYA